MKGTFTPIRAGGPCPPSFIPNKTIVPRITRRERDVLRWMAKGKSNVEIAHLLGLSPNTIKHHVTHLLKKLQAKNRTQAVLIAIEMQMCLPA